MAKRREEANGHADAPPLAVAVEEPQPNPPPEEEDHGDQPNRPVHVVRFGLVKASIWLTQGQYGPRHHVTVSRAYKGDDNNWYHTTTFTLRDLLPLAKALDWAHSWIAESIASNDTPF